VGHFLSQSPGLRGSLAPRASSGTRHATRQSWPGRIYPFPTHVGTSVSAAATRATGDNVTRPRPSRAAVDGSVRVRRSRDRRPPPPRGRGRRLCSSPGALPLTRRRGRPRWRLGRPPRGRSGRGTASS
jgi:hypothetical protein